ncbi:MAG: histidine kinase N-terminal 7TM domain-containing protein [Clostridia bacterium]|nr:histidine kinase N-terminal 7TM domain-containing protein [Clostridia bacterium]
MKEKNNKALWIVVALVVVTAAVIRLVNNQITYDAELFTAFIRSLLHMGLIAAWGFSLYRRVVQKQARRYLCGIAVLMLLWLNFKVLKYYICTDVTVIRYLWYLYYLPLVGIPLYMLFASLFIGKTEDYSLKWQTKLLYIPAVLLFLMIITNDLHRFAFSFPQHDFSPDNYRHEIGYFLVFGWFALCSFASFYVMYSGGKIRRKPRAYAPLIVTLVLTIYYIITYMVGNPATKLLAADLSSASSLLFAAVFESCIYCGLIPTNTRYDEMFVASVGNSAQIVDENFQVRYASASAEPLPAEQIKKAQETPVALSEGKLLHTAPIGGGYTVWTEDISELTDLRRELTETKEELEERTAMLRHEYVLEKDRKVTAEQNRLYDLLTASTQKQIDRIACLMKEYELAGGDEEKGNAVLSKIAVLGGYVKRKKHLTLSVQNGFDIPQGELKNAIEESVRYLKAMGASCVVFVDTERDFLPGRIACAAYDFFEDAVEAALDSITSCAVSVSVVEGVLRARVTVGCKEDLSFLGKDWQDASVEKSDENEWELILPLRGGERR